MGRQPFACEDLQRAACIPVPLDELELRWGRGSIDRSAHTDVESPVV